MSHFRRKLNRKYPIFCPKIANFQQFFRTLPVALPPEVGHFRLAETFSFPPVLEFLKFIEFEADYQTSANAGVIGFVKFGDKQKKIVGKIWWFEGD